MEREWVPAASALLSARRRDFLAPLWRDIGRALDPVPFDPEHSERHASRAYREGLDWERLRRSVLAVPGYEDELALLVRLAEACWRLRDGVKAAESWFAFVSPCAGVTGHRKLIQYGQKELIHLTRPSA